MTRILLITSITDEATSPQRATLRKFVSDVNDLDKEVRMSFCAAEELIFLVKGGTPGVVWQGKELSDEFDVIHLRNANLYPDYANALQTYAQFRGLTLINQGDAVSPFFGKVSQGLLYAVNGVPTPDLISSPRNSELLNYLGDHMPGYPFILKHNNGIKGRDNYLIQDYQQLVRILEQPKHGFVAQDFIANDGELRVLVFGQDMQPMVFRKKSVGGTHLNNTSQGGEAEEIAADSVDPEIIQTAKKAALLTNRAIAGVDVLLATDGSWCILETNATPSIASGVLVEKKLQFYIDYMKRLKRESK